MFVVKLLRDQQGKDGRLLWLIQAKKGCIGCQPIVLLPKTMINLRAWCCFHHNPHHPVVRTDNDCRVCPEVFLPIFHASGCHECSFLAHIWYSCWLAGCSPQLCLYGNVLHRPRLQGNCWVCCKYCFVQNARRFMQCVCTSSGSETNMLARLLVIIFRFFFTGFVSFWSSWLVCFGWLARVKCVWHLSGICWGTILDSRQMPRWGPGSILASSKYWILHAF